MENNVNLTLKSLSSDEINKIEEFRKSNQTAVLVILFSDIVNSTYAAEKLGEQPYSKLRYIHDELFKKIMCRENVGIIIKEIGDSFLCVFAEPSTAVLRAVEFQRAIHSNKQNLTVQNYTLTVKIGIHVGQVAIENSLALDIFGRHVNRAARIESIAGGGQILTSLAIWENAVGWLKDTNDEKIGWVSYGKIKLKGIEERIDIYGFYAIEIGKQSTPAIFRKQKQIRTTYILTILAVLAVLSFFVLSKINKKAAVASNARKTYYVLFDFSELAKKGMSEFQKLNVDTLSIKEDLTSQAISILYPDSVITESDLIDLSNKQGVPYSRSVPDFFKSDSASDDLFYTQCFSFNLTGEFFLKFFPTPSSFYLHKRGLKQKAHQAYWKNDSISLFQLAFIKGSSFPQEDIVCIKNISNDFHEIFQNLINLEKNTAIVGTVLAYKDSTLLFKLTNDKIRKGTLIEVSRSYIGKKGTELELSNIQEEINFYENKSQYLQEFKKAIEKFNKIKSFPLKESQSRGASISGKGKVIELYDSTGVAIFTRKGIVPWDIPKKGDLIWLTH